MANDGDRIARYSITLGGSILISLCVFGIAILLKSSTLSTTLSVLVKWGLIPLVSYGLAMGFNSLMQQMQCGEVKMKTIASASISTPIALIIGFLIIAFAPFLLAPIKYAAPYSTPDTLYSINIAFVSFWATLYSLIMSCTTVAICPKK
jgi:hypothetical protein